MPATPASLVTGARYWGRWLTLGGFAVSWASTAKSVELAQECDRFSGLAFSRPGRLPPPNKGIFPVYLVENLPKM